MPTYEIYKKDGTPVRVEGPEGATTEQLIDLHLSRKQKPSYIDALSAYRESAARDKPGTIIDQIQELGKGTVGGLAGLVETAALGGATLFEEDTELWLRDYIQDAGDYVQGAVAPDANIGVGASAVPRKFGEALGSFAGILGAAMIPYAGVPLAAGLAVGAGAGEASERAREADATQEERNKATRFGAAIGASELISPLRLLRKLPFLNKAGNFFGDETVGGIIGRGRRVLTEAGVEGAQEFSAAVAQNWVERGYNPENDLITQLAKETGEPAAYGSAVGFTAKLADEIYRAIQMITPRTRGGSASATTAPVESDAAADKIVDDIEKITTGKPITEEVSKAVKEVTGESAITEEGQDLLDTIDDEGIIPELKGQVLRVLKDNNIKVTKNTKPEDAIKKLRDKAKVTLDATAKEDVGGGGATLDATVRKNVGPEPFKAEVVKINKRLSAKTKADFKAREDKELTALDEKYKPLIDGAKTRTEKNQLREEKKSERRQILGRYTKARTDALVRQAELVKESEIAQAEAQGEVKADLIERTEKARATLAGQDVKAEVKTEPKPEDIEKGETITGVLQEEVDVKKNKEALEKYTVAFETNATPDAVKAAERDTLEDDSTTLEDKERLIALIEGKIPKSKKVKGKSTPIKDVAKAKAYFLQHGPTPQAALDVIAFDIGENTPKFKKSPEELTALETGTASDVFRAYTKIMEGTGSKAAQEARKWVDANLSESAKQKLVDKIAKARSGKMTDKQLSDRAEEIIGKKTVSVEDQTFAAELDKLEDAKKKEQLQERWARAKTKEDKEKTIKSLRTKIFQETKRQAYLDNKTWGKVVGKKPTLAIPSSEVTSLTINLDSEVNTLIEQGDAKGALNKLSEDTQLSEPLSLLAKRMSEVMKDVKIVVKDIGNLAGRFDSATNTIELSPESGMNAHVLMHEAAHAVTFANLSNKSHPATKQLSTLFKEVKDSLDTAYGTQSLQEFVSEVFSNPQFQQKLARINVRGQPVSALQRFTNTVVNFFRQLIGKPTTPLTALQSASADIAQLLAPTEDAVGTGILQATSDAEGAVNTLQSIAEDNRDQGQLTKEEGKGFILDAVSFLGDTKMGKVGKKILTGLSDMLTVGNMADAAGLVDANNVGFGDQLVKAFNNQRGDMDAAGRDFDDVMKKVVKRLPKDNKRRDLLDELIYSREFGATIYQVDPTKPRKEYEKDADLAIVWDKQQKIWKNNPDFGQEGRDAFNDMRNYYKRYFTKLQKVLGLQADKAVGGEVDKDGVKVSDKLQRVFKKIFDNKALDVYFPLVREGDYSIAYNITPEAMARRKRAKEDTGDARVYELVSTEAEQKARVAELKADPDVNDTTIEIADNTNATINNFKNAPPTSFVGEVMDILNNAKGLDKTLKDDLQTDIVQLFINTLPETSFAKSLQKREGVKGYIPDSIYAFNKKGFALGRQVAQLENIAKIRAISRDMSKKAKELKDPAVDRIAAELEERVKFATTGANSTYWEQYVKTANQLAFVYTIGGNASSALVNLSQVPLFVYPYLGAEHGFINTNRALGNATRIVMNSGNSIDQLFDFNAAEGTYKIRDSIDSYGVKRDLSPRQKEIAESILPLVKLAARRGQLTRTFLADALGLGEEGAKSRRKDKKGKITDTLSLDNLTSLSAVMFNQAERFNRQVTLLASYQLALRQEVDPRGKIKDFSEVAQAANKIEGATERAAEKALRQTQETNGGAVLETGPRYSQQGMGRIAFMYKTYGLRMYSTMLKSTKELLDKSLPPEERYIAFKQLAGVHMSALFFAGVQGLPLYGAIEMIANAFLGDDEEDFDSIVRRQFREPTYKGALNYFTGIDVATRVRLTGLLIQENRFNRDASLEESFFHYAGGPAFGTMDRLYRGFQDLGMVGDRDTIEVERAIENFLPASVANAYKAFGRVRREGYKTRRGDPIYDDVTSGDLAVLLFGFPPVEYTNQMEKNNILNNIDRTISKRKTSLTTQYYRAYRHNDLSGMSEALDKIVKWNNKYVKYPELIITPKTIERSLKRHIKTSQNIGTHNGVYVQNKGLIQEFASSFDDNYTFFD